MDSIIVTIYVLLFGGIILGAIYVRNEEKTNWNKGICSKCGEPWGLYDVDSNGRRMYSCKNHHGCAISYKIDKRRNIDMKNTKVISSFPGCGKTYCFDKYKDSGIKILDSDSSEFSWVKDENGINTKERNPDFPMNYINHIKENLGNVDIIFVSSHDIVRSALKENDINYILVYPCLGAKEEYINRYSVRGSDENFIKFIESNYEKFINDMQLENFPQKIELNYEETLDDLLKYGYCQGYVAKYLDAYRGCPIECNRCPYKENII